MQKSEIIIELMIAVGGLQAECIKIKKDSTNPHFKSKYASLPTILDEIQPILTKYELAYTQVPENGKITTLLMHTKSGQWIQSEYDLNSTQNTPQAIGSAITYARRYSLTSTLGLNIDDDDDGNAASAPKKQQQPAPQAPIDPFKLAYSDPRAIIATLATATSKQQIVSLYSANKATVEASDDLKKDFKDAQARIENNGKLIINDEQFKQVCNKIRNRDTTAYDNAMKVYLLNEKQAEQLGKLHANLMKLEGVIKQKHDDPKKLIQIIEACTCEAQVNELHKNNALIMDRDQEVGTTTFNKLNSLKAAA
jgi:hypothetical protein